MMCFSAKMQTWAAAHPIPEMLLRLCAFFKWRRVSRIRVGFLPPPPQKQAPCFGVIVHLVCIFTLRYFCASWGRVEW